MTDVWQIHTPKMLAETHYVCQTLNRILGLFFGEFAFYSTKIDGMF